MELMEGYNSCVDFPSSSMTEELFKLNPNAKVILRSVDDFPALVGFQVRWLKIKEIYATFPISVTLFSNHLKWNLADTLLRFGGSLAPQCQHQFVTEINLVFEKISTRGMIQRRIRFWNQLWIQKIQGKNFMQECSINGLLHLRPRKNCHKRKKITKVYFVLW